MSEEDPVGAAEVLEIVELIAGHLLHDLDYTVQQLVRVCGLPSESPAWGCAASAENPGLTRLRAAKRPWR